MMPSKARLTWWEIPFLALAPFAAIIAFQISPVNQAGTVDPWLYTGLARNLAASWVQFGPTYYAVRFSALLPMTLAFELCGDVGGYLVLHYLAYVLLAGSLYATVRRLCDRSVAAVTILFLVCNPLATRFLVWDYVNFLAIPYFMASIAFWTLGAGRSPLWRVLAGFFAAAAIMAHLYVGIGLAIFYLVETISAAWRGRAAFFRLTLNAAYAAIGFALCLVLGWLGYVAILGWFSPIDLLRPTMAIAAEMPDIANRWSMPFLDWAAHSYNVYIPVIVAMTALAATRFKLRGTPAILWFSLGYLAVIFGSRMIAATFVLEQSYYFSYLAPAIFLLLAITLSNLPGRKVSLTLFCIATVSVAAAHVWLPRIMAPLYVRMSGAFGILWMLAGVSIAIGLLIFISRQHRAAAPVAAAALAITLQVAGFSTPDFGGLYGKPADTRDWGWPSYMTGTSIADITKRHWRPNERVLIWRSNSTSDAVWSPTFVGFWGQLNDLWGGSGMPELGTPQLQKLSDARVTQILLVSGQPSMIDGGEAALEQAGFKIKERERETLGYAPAQSYARLVEIIERPTQ
ncbi:4-amino-4-deoxy-L-arabinose transferase [Rhizobiales bacterium GAS188]|nr:4-amino-4-deoxy-L-arabinose transferase [Rhizobiales bacterium GAS188]